MWFKPLNRLLGKPDNQLAPQPLCVELMSSLHQPDCLLVGLFTVADKLKNLVPTLGKRGPHRVLTGDLNFAGIPGKVYTPAEGKGIPGVAFGHDWKLGVDAYHATLRHLASWGIAVAAPDTEKGWVPNHRGFAADLETALQILAGVRLGNGNVVVQPNNLFLAGHGMGASAAVIAATNRPYDKVANSRRTPTLKGVMAIYPSDATPSPYEAAKHVSAPGLVLEPGSLVNVASGNAARMAAQWEGDVIYRKIEAATHDGFHEKVLRKFLVGTASLEFSKQELVRALMTGFVLAEDSSKYKEFRETNLKLKGTETATQHELFSRLPENADLQENLKALL